MSHLYTPDRWVLVRVVPEPAHAPFDCVLAGWVGGYLGSDEWRRSTPIVERRDAETHWEFIGESGSTYRCHKASYGCTGLMGAVFTSANQQQPDAWTLLPDPNDDQHNPTQ
jgi:hypothetical protein